MACKSSILMLHQTEKLFINDVNFLVVENFIFDEKSNFDNKLVDKCNSNNLFDYLLIKFNH